MSIATGKTTLLASTASATQSQSFSLKHASKNQQATIQVIGLTSTNKAYLQVQNLIDGTWTNLLLNGSAVYCDVNNNLASDDIDYDRG